MGKGSKIFSVRIPDNLLARIHHRFQLKGHEEGEFGGCLGDWIRECIVKSLGEERPNQAATKPETFTCMKCGKRKNLALIAVKTKLLTGKIKYGCMVCYTKHTKGK